MYSQCPACATLFRMEEALSAGGTLRARCGMCAEIFDPRQRYAEALPPPFLAHVPLPDTGQASGVSPIERWYSEHKPASEAPSTDNEPSPLVRWADQEDLPDSEMSSSGTDWHLVPHLEMEMRSGKNRSAPARGTGWWVVGVLMLVVLLIGQVFWFQREELAGYPELRPVLSSLCSVAGCELPLPRDTSRLQLLRAQVTDHPEKESALVASASLVNGADFRQSYPLLKLSLLDAEQNVVGERWFHPRDYLEDPAQRENWQQGMPPQRPIAVRFAVQDPGSGSAQYVFDFR